MNTHTITKYQHACLVIAKDGQSLVIDPGGWSHDFVVPKGVVGVVVTHEHQDHLDRSKLKDIIAKNPTVTIYGPSAVTEQLENMRTHPVSANDSLQVGPFELRFFGNEHALVDASLPVAANIGVLVDGTLYYPGDSFTVPDVAVETLALPVSAPWLKFSEASAFLRSVEPKHVFPTHDAILSDDGKSLADMMFGGVSKQIGAEYTRL